ncbi:hypothetical protein JVU11DRAFT_13087 [Chiua virens]|nr:hypothetical protein JVU11DRAFT_13087 [Chiua virens]
MPSAEGQPKKRRKSLRVRSARASAPSSDEEYSGTEESHGSAYIPAKKIAIAASDCSSSDFEPANIPEIVSRMAEERSVNAVNATKAVPMEITEAAAIPVTDVVPVANTLQHIVGQFDDQLARVLSVAVADIPRECATELSSAALQLSKLVRDLVAMHQFEMGRNAARSVAANVCEIRQAVALSNSEFPVLATAETTAAAKTAAEAEVAAAVEAVAPANEDVGRHRQGEGDDL